MKSCYRSLPEVATDAVEISPEAIALRDVFRISVDEVVCADGADYVAKEDIQTDVILLETFVAERMASRCAETACFARMSRAFEAALYFTRLPSGLFVL